MSFLEISPFLIVLLIWLIIKVMRNHYILGKRAVNQRAKQNLCKKYNPNVIRGKDGRFKRVQSPHLNKR
jgi:flagellar biogenesis protein FliO